ncbi:MAG: zinc ribbon domain-containing protein [Ktedonobacteraceae bacterium]
MQCISCGTSLQPGMGVCPACGAPIAYSATPAPIYGGETDPTFLAAGNAPYQESAFSSAQLSNRTLQANAYPPPAAAPLTPAPPAMGYPRTPPPSPYGPPPPAQRQRLSRGIIILLAVLVVLMIIGGGMIYYFSVPYPAQARANATATAQTRANNAATGTAVVVHNDDATATAQAQATLTVQQNMYTQATSGPLLLNDSLAQNSASQWNSYNSAANSGCVFSGGAYHVIEQQTGYFNPCFANGPTFSNFTFQVQMTILKGEAGGMLFRANNQAAKFYLLSINADQSYGLYTYSSNTGSNATTVFLGSSFAIKGLNQPNLVTLIAQGNQLTLFVNKHYIDSATDGTYKAGQIALVADSHNQPTEVAYTNAQVWKL